MNSIDRVLQSVERDWPPCLWQGSIVVLAVSGGADSIALLRAIAQLQPILDRCVVAHFNHALRGQESDLDQEFVQHTASQFGMQCIVEKAMSNSKTKPSENSLRILRHQFLARVAMDHQAAWVALAHQTDDQVETFLHHLIRGSGPRGLSGMPIVRPSESTANLRWVRPMLRVRRVHILEYLEELKQSFRTDSTNASIDYSRNRIRNELLPWLRDYVQSDLLDQRLAQACELIREEHEYIDLQARRWLDAMGIPLETSLTDDHRITLPVEACADENWTVVRQAMVLLWHRHRWPLGEMNYRHWRNLREFISQSAQTTHRKHIEFPGGVSATCQRGILMIALVP